MAGFNRPHYQLADQAGPAGARTPQLITAMQCLQATIRSHPTANRSRWHTTRGSCVALGIGIVAHQEHHNGSGSTTPESLRIFAELERAVVRRVVAEKGTGPLSSGIPWTNASKPTSGSLYRQWSNSTGETEYESGHLPHLRALDFTFSTRKILPSANLRLFCRRRAVCAPNKWHQLLLIGWE